MIIALDWDSTATADLQLFEVFVTAAQSRGHQIIIVTGRQANDPITVPWPAKPQIVYAGDSWKKDAARLAGFHVDVWIDDEPGHIEPGRKLIW